MGDSLTVRFVFLAHITTKPAGKFGKGSSRSLNFSCSVPLLKSLFWLMLCYFSVQLPIR